MGLSLLLVAWCALTVASLLARATEHVQATYAGISRVELTVGFESVEVTGSAEATSVTLTRSYTWSLHKPSIVQRRDGNRLPVTSSCPFTVGLGCSGRIRLVVPRDVTLSLSVGDGHLAVSHLRGPVDARSTDGGIAASDPSGPVVLRTRDGSVTATGLRSASVESRSTDGRLQLSFATAPTSVTASTSDGSVRILVPRDETAYRVTTTTTDGSRSVTVPMDSRSERHIDVRTTDGSILVARGP